MNLSDILEKTKEKAKKSQKLEIKGVDDFADKYRPELEPSNNSLEENSSCKKELKSDISMSKDVKESIDEIRISQRIYNILLKNTDENRITAVFSLEILSTNLGITKDYLKKILNGLSKEKIIEHIKPKRGDYANSGRYALTKYKINEYPAQEEKESLSEKFIYD